MNSHSHIFERLLKEHETPDGKIPPPVVLYMPPEVINKGGDTQRMGACCGKCAMFNAPKSECFITSPPACDADHGVCGLFVGGTFVLSPDVRPQQYVPKTVAGYIKSEDVPTHCGNCEYFEAEGESPTGKCQKVGGVIHRGGCCNGWEPKPSEGEED